MSDREKRPIFEPLKWALYLISLAYGAGIAARAVLYKYGIFKTDNVLTKVISVGNLTLGGTGKTPFVIMLARIMKDEIGRETAVLIRGYGWDEQAMLKANLGETPVMVGEDRTKSCRKAIRLYGSDTAILDDGFQHWELARDLDIVLVDSRNPFGNGLLFPRGILREPKEAVRRADIVVFTKTNKKLSDTAALKIDLARVNGRLIFLEAVHRPKSLYNIGERTTLDLGSVKDKRVILLSSIGDPDYFEETVRGLGAQVLGHMRFSDHYDYKPSDIDDIIKRLERERYDFLITTEKDSVKLVRLGLSLARARLASLIVEMELTSGREALIDRLHRLYSD